jgi:predicted ATP-grasp superfamily ATP-dependent carboligase
MADGGAVLIAAMSGRALAQSARRGGYLPLVADFFGDQDTLQAAAAHVRFGGSLAHGIKENHLMRALEELSRDHRALGIVCGTGFEDRTGLLERVAERWPLFGNAASVVAGIKDPENLAVLCRKADVAFPDFELTKPPALDDWLVKRTGGAGGAHIKTASDAAGSNAVYYQRKMPGSAVSALFLADGRRAELLGFSTQWCSPVAGKPYRYGGAVRPARLAPAMEASLASAVGRLAAAASLIGLNSADFLVEDDRYWLLEVNPRPGATLDIFEPPGGSLCALHIAACAGNLAAAPHYSEGAKASAIVYAEEDIPSFPPLEWPDWTADRPRAGSAVKAGDPLCTVYACGPVASGAKTLADERCQIVLAWTRAGH